MYWKLVHYVENEFLYTTTNDFIYSVRIYLRLHIICDMNVNTDVYSVYYNGMKIEYWCDSAFSCILQLVIKLAE